MERKRNRSFEQDQSKDHLMSDSLQNPSFQSELGHKKSSFFTIPGLFIGFNVKGVSDSDSVRSPTSPLDYKTFSNLGNPIRSPRSNLDGSQKSWNCSKVGLGIVDSLNDEMKPTEKILGSPKSKNIIFGSRMGINIPSSPSCLNGRIDSSTYNSIETKSLPKDYAIDPLFQINSPELHLKGSGNSLGSGEIQLKPKNFARNRSCLSDSGKPVSDFNNLLGMKPSSLPMSFGSVNGIKGPVSASDIELSEDYTCVISHGPNPKTTHIFGDCILECHNNELDNCIKEVENKIEAPPINESSGDSLQNPYEDFLSFCYLCKKNLEGKDIYIYRGEKAFCSSNCRSEAILVEEEMGNPENNPTNNSTRPICIEEVFLPLTT